MKTKVSKRDRILVTLFVAAQILVPAGLLGLRWMNEGSQPTREYRFSWQMYSAAHGGDYVGTTRDGNQESLNVYELPPVVRGIGYDDSVPRMFCEKNPELVQVQRQTQNEWLQDYTEPVTC